MSSETAWGRIASVPADTSPPTLGDVVLAVERRLLVRQAAKRTTTEYVEEAQGFGAWFEAACGREASLADLTVAWADGYLAAAIEAADERGRPWSKDTIGHHVAQLRAFGGHAAAACGLAANPMAELSGPERTKRRDRTADGLEDEEIMALLSRLNPGRNRDLVALGLIAIGYENGPRTSELSAADVPDFSIATVSGRPLGPVLEIRHPAKRGPNRTLPLGRRAEDALRLLVGNRTSGPLFPSRTGERLYVDGIRDLVGRAGERAGLALSPQRLRRSAASWQQAYGAGSGHLDTAFGWAPDPADVKSGHYTKPTRTQLLYAHQTRLSPLDRLELRVGRLPFV